MAGCEKAKLLALLKSLERELEKMCRRGAEIVRVYEERIEELLAAEAEAELFG